MVEFSRTWEEKLTKTGQTQEDRRQALEKLGISVESSGIKVEKNKCFLVNLNSDPSLNEMLVYYLKENTLVGRTGSDADIQLSGIGIHDRHCLINVNSENQEVSLTPYPGARTCINGAEVDQLTFLKNGDRIFWGANHFFRINCPKIGNSDPVTPSVPFDWKMAQEEVMQAANDPIQVKLDTGLILLNE